MPFSVENKETVSAPCLSLWERCLSEAKTERVHAECDRQNPLSRLRRQLSRRESQGYGIRNGAYRYRYAP